VCDECSSELRGAAAASLNVDQLVVVIYCCTSLEKRLLTHRIDLATEDAGDSIATDVECVNSTLAIAAGSLLIDD
jgi:hypothetical protein